MRIDKKYSVFFFFQTFHIENMWTITAYKIRTTLEVTVKQDKYKKRKGYERDMELQHREATDASKESMNPNHTL